MEPIEVPPCDFCRLPDCPHCFPKTHTRHRVKISGGPDGASIVIRNDKGELFPPIVTGATIKLGHNELAVVDMTLLADNLDVEAALSEETEEKILALADRIRAARSNA